MALDAKVKQIFADHGAGPRIFALATASKEGVPNVVPIGFLWVEGDEIRVIDNFLNKTLENIKSNPICAVYAMGGKDGKECVQVKGKAVYETSGPEYEAAFKMARSKSDKYPAKGLVRITPCAVYDTTPGPNAGKKL
ncbi:MAG: pyridoxamine 5'-phosphate oxidase [Thermoplasmata archaeon]|nr:pyridoxamine 5'-phosphate oxidase [Thermoplasmata archaeon]